MLLILTPGPSPRQAYAFDLLLGRLLGITWEITHSEEEFRTFQGPGFCYGKRAGEALCISPAGLLEEHGIREQEVEIGIRHGVPVLFPDPDPASDPGFDPFAAAFYMVSRYEEYLPFDGDAYGRFTSSASIASRSGFLHLPVVHAWAGLLQDALRRRFPGLEGHPPAYRYVPTIDIDHAWAYRGRSVARTMGALGRAAMRADMEDIAARLKVLAGRSRDPYDTYDFLEELHAQYGNQPLWFILHADYGGEDNNVSPGTGAYHALLKRLDREGRLGIHPSLSSNRSFRRLEEEYGGLCDLLDRDVNFSRQHFLKFSFPGTFRALEKLGITDDFSMGYADRAGFRAGIAMPFPFFDLGRNHVTGLVIHPVSIMDVTLRDYLRLTPDAALEMVHELIRTVRHANGEFVSLWHNESLSETRRWKGWRRVYMETVRAASA